MTFTRLGDEHFDMPQRLDLSRDARLLEVEAIVWSNRTGTDGAIAERHLRRITDAEDPHRLAAELVEQGLWAPTPEGWQVADWSKTQPLAAAVRQRRERHAEEQRRSRERKEKHQDGDHSDCTTWCPVKRGEQSREGSRRGSRDNAVSTSVSGPIPSHPIPPEGMGGEDEGRALGRCPSGRPYAADGSCCGDLTHAPALTASESAAAAAAEADTA